MVFWWLLSVVGFSYWIYRLQQRVKNLEQFSGTAETQRPAVSLRNTPSPEDDPFVEDDIDRSKWPEHLKNQYQANQAKAHNTSPSDVSNKSHSSKTASTKADKKSAETHLDFEQFLGQKLFPILGATSIVVAIGFFAIWSFANGWVGPMGRIAIGLIVSLGLMGLGEALKRKYPDFFTLLVGAGLAGLIITTLLSHYVYDFISSFQALVLVALQAGVGVLLSLRYNSRILANFSIAAGLLAPWFTGELNPMIILPFVLVLTIACFSLAVQKKWPEIFVGLLVIGSSYIFAATAQLNRQLLEFDRDFEAALSVLGEAVINPYLLLGFAAVIYGLIGSAGIVRLVRSYKDTEPPKEESGEIFIFTLSLLLFNLVAVGVYSAQEWQHIGFLVLFQALMLLGVANWFKEKQWPHFHLMTLSSSLLFIILATLWEMRDFEPLIIAIALVVEAMLMCVIGQMSKQVVYEWFGRITLLIAYGYSVSVSNPELLLEALLSFVFITGFLFSIGNPKLIPDRIWLGVSLFFASEILFRFSFDSGLFPEFFMPFLPVLWVLGLTYMAYLHNSLFLRIAAYIAFLFVGVGTLSLELENDWLSFSTWFWILIMGAGLMSLRVQINQQTQKETIFGYCAVIFLVLSWIISTSKSVEEPGLTLSWLALIGVLMTLGLKFNQFKEIRYVGLGFMLFVIAKIYLVDIWQWDTPIRVVAFTGLGIALLLIGFFYQKIWLKK